MILLTKKVLIGKRVVPHIGLGGKGVSDFLKNILHAYFLPKQIHARLMS